MKYSEQEWHESIQGWRALCAIHFQDGSEKID